MRPHQQHVSLLPADRPATRPGAWSPADDVLLVRAAQAGDTASFDVLYRRHARFVHGVLLGRSTREDVEDLVQEVFLTAWRRLSSLRDPAAFGGWLVVIARHLRVDHGRRAGWQDVGRVRSPSAPSEDAGRARYPIAPVGPAGGHGGRVVRLEDIASTEAGADSRLEALRALGAIRALPEAYRETLMLRLVEGMTGPEIAARTGLTPESVRVNLCRGMKLLRASLLSATPP